MKGSSFFAIIAITLGMAAPATAAQSDPEIIIYRFPGVRDSGAGAGSGAVTAFHCTNFSGATETIRYVTRTNNGALTTNMTISIPHLSTVTTATSGLVAYTLDLALNTGILGGAKHWGC